MTGLTRDQIVEAAKKAACDECDPESGCGPHCEYQKGAEDAVDAVLRLLADDLAQMSHPKRDDYAGGYDDGCAAAADRLRSLLPEGDDQ